MLETNYKTFGLFFILDFFGFLCNFEFSKFQYFSRNLLKNFKFSKLFQHFPLVTRISKKIKKYAFFSNS